MAIKYQLTKIDAKWKANFKTLVACVQGEVQKQEYFNSITLMAIKIGPTNSYGYYTKLLKPKQIDGAIYLWIDNYANHSRPKLSISYYNKSIEPILKIAKRLQNLDSTLKINLKWFSDAKPNEFILQKPLSLKYFNKFIIENFEDENYLTVVLADNLNSSLNKKGLVKNIIKFINILTGTILITSTKKATNVKVRENDKILATHIRRERNLKYRADRKIKDNYTCQVCGFNRTRKLGPIGSAALEVHHLTPLSQSEKRVYSGINDLITVCANCHKMIHKMGGSKTAFTLLKRKYYGKKD